MKNKCIPRLAFQVFLVLSLIIFPSIVLADSILVTSGDFTGFRVSPTASGISATDGWDGGSFQISWNITLGGGPLPFHYEYTISNPNNGDTGALSKGLSHFLLEVSPDFTQEDISISLITGDPKTYSPNDPGNSNPNLPADIFGIKVLSDGGTGPIILAFDSSRAPIWGDFYAKDGSDAHGTIDVTAWNAGFGTDPISSTTNFTPWIPTPDTTGPPVPEPGTMVLLGSGLIGLAGWGKKKFRK